MPADDFNLDMNSLCAWDRCNAGICGRSDSFPLSREVEQFPLAPPARHDPPPPLIT